ncbi:MAG: metal-dependent transcriptional regulator [Defluviitaleaceae bacterium]|nr:metal-dependent transcriptional regulator [Defluviitaleaceae bacterium]
MKIRASAEDYLEAILVIGKGKNNVRAVDIVKHTGYARASISIALKQLKESGCIEVDNNHSITLTDKGAQVAKRTYRRHLLIGNFLIALGVDEKTAFADACKLEHVISESSFECLNSYYQQNFAPANEKNHPQAGGGINL